MMPPTRALPFLLLTLALCASGAAAQPQRSARGPSRPALWVTAYYPVWQQSSGRLTPSEIDYTAFSDLVHFAILPNPDGSIAATGDTITPEQSRAILAPAHAAGRKVLVCVGGENSAPRFRPALRDSTRAAFVDNLVRFVTTRGYDGLDVDMEPTDDADVGPYEAFIHALRARLRAANPRLLLTAAVGSQPAMFARLQTEFDRINLMTYDLSGPWPGWVTWHNAALSDGGARFPGPGRPLPSAQGMVRQFVAAGADPRRLGIGIAFFGYVWHGATGPQQSIQGVKCDSDVDYSALMDRYYRPERYRWDDGASAPYLSVGSPDPAQRLFVSYDDERLCADKIAYARRAGLGGVIIWELAIGHRANQPPGRRDPLLQAVKRAWLNPGGRARPAAAGPAPEDRTRAR